MRLEAYINYGRKFGQVDYIMVLWEGDHLDGSSYSE